jgi:putative transcriptional regulator
MITLEVTDMVKVDIENGTYLFKLDDLLNSSHYSKNKVMRDTNTDFKVLQRIIKGELTKIDVTVFARLCDYFDCSLTDIVEYIPKNR